MPNDSPPLSRERLESLQQELEQRVRQQTKELQEAEERLRLIGQFGTDGFWDWNLLTDEAYLSPNFKALFGYEDHELPNHASAWQNLIFPEDLERVQQAFIEHTTKGKPYDLQVRYRHKNSSTVWVTCRGVALKDESGRFVRMAGTHINITKQKEAEAALQRLNEELQERIVRTSEVLHTSEERLRLSTEAAQIGLWERDLRTNRLTWSTRQEQLMGYEPGTFPNTYEAFFALVHPEDHLKLAAAQKIARETGVYQAEIRFRLRDGRERWGLLRGRAIYDETGTPEQLVGIDVDITERKRDEAALSKSREQLRLMIEQAPVSIAMFDRNMCYLAASLRWKEDYGIQAQELIGRSHYDVFPDLPERWKAVHQKALAGETIQNDEDEWLLADGNRRWFRWTAQPWHDAYDEIGGIIIATEDITPRKRAEELLRKSEQQLKAVIENLAEGLIITDMGGQLSQWNRAALEMHGFSELEEALLLLPEMEKIFELSELDGRVLQSDERPNARIRRGESLRNYELRIRRKDTGLSRIFSYSGNLILPQSRNPVFVVTMTDITERKRAEEEVNRHRAQLQAVFDSIQDGIVVCDMKGQFMLVNEAEARITGFASAAEMLQNLDFYTEKFQLTYPTGAIMQVEDWPLNRILRGEKITDLELAACRLDTGQEWVFSYSGEPVIDTEGAPFLAVIVTRDVTKQKLAEKQLRLWADAFEHCAHGLAIGDPANNSVVACNSAFAQMQQATVADIIGGPILSTYAPSEWDSVKNKIAEADRVGKSQYESLMVRQDGTLVPIQMDVVSVADETGKILYRVATRQDISARKQAEESLRIEKERLEKLAMASPSAMYSFRVAPDGKRTQLFSSPVNYELYGFTSENSEQLQALILDRIPPGNREQVIRTMLAAQQTSSVYHEIYPYLHPQKGKIWIETFATPMIEPDGSVTWHGIANDVTERNRAEERLRQSEAHFRALFEAGGVGSVECDAQTGQFIRVNQKMCEIVGYSRKELLQLTFHDITHVDDRAIVLKQYSDFVQGYSPVYEIEKRYRRKDGSAVWVSITSSLLHDQAGQPWHTVAVIQDITDRKKAEEELRESEERFRTLFEQSAVGKVILDYDGNRVVDCNQTAAKDLGYTREEMRQLALEDIVVSQTAGAITLNHQALAHQQNLKLQAQHRTKIGEIRDALVILTNIRIRGKDYIYSSVMDITEQKRAEKQLEKERLRLEKIAFSSPSVIYSFHLTPDDQFSFPYVSAAFYELFGLRQVDVRDDARAIYGKIHPDDVSGVIQSVRESAQNLSRWHHAWRANHPEKGEVWVEGYSAPIREADGSITWHGIMNDVTEQKRAEQALRKNQERLTLALGAARMGVWEQDLQTNEVFWSPECYEVLGIKIFAGTLEAFYDLVYPEDRKMLKQIGTQITLFPDTFSAEFRTLLPDGNLRWISSLGRLQSNKLGEPVRLIGTIQNITERKLAEVELEQSLEQIRSLAAHIQDVREEERKRIARELHDELGQALASLKYDLAWLENHTIPTHSETDKSLKKKTQTMSKLIDSTIKIGRKIATELRPRVLDDLGLIAALKWQARDFQARSEIQCEFITMAEELTLDPGRATAAFRICQEALTNVSRHAQATAVTIRLHIEDQCLHLEIKDNGRGITKRDINRSGSLGLVGMKERVLPYGGNMDIQGHLGKGTTVTVSLPLVTD